MPQIKRRRAKGSQSAPRAHRKCDWPRYRKRLSENQTVHPPQNSTPMCPPRRKRSPRASPEGCPQADPMISRKASRQTSPRANRGTNPSSDAAGSAQGKLAAYDTVFNQLNKGVTNMGGKMDMVKG